MSDTKQAVNGYKGYRVTKVTQPSGRKTYDITAPDGQLCDMAVANLAIVRATINAYLQDY